MTAERKDKLSKDTIIKHALKLVDAEGLDSLSFRSLGKEFGVSQAAFYRHIPDKTALLDGITDALWREIFSSFNSALNSTNTRQHISSWRDVIRLYGHTLYTVLHQHPHAVIIFMTRPMSTTTQYTLAASSLSAIANREIELPSNNLALLNIISSFVAGFVVAEITPSQGDGKIFSKSEASDVLSHTSANTQELLTELLEPMTHNDWSFGKQFDEGLESFIRGWRE